jgi:peptidyl-prolyl cis-trans isomerase C
MKKKEMSVMKHLKDKTFRVVFILIAVMVAASAVSCKEKPEATDKTPAAAVETQISSEKKETAEQTVDQAAGQKDYVAVINGVPIPAGDVERQFNMVKRRYDEMGMEMPPEQVADVKNRITDSLIEQELLFQASQAQDISVDQSEVDDELEKFRQGFPDEATFQAQMAEMGYTEDALKNEIKRSKAIQQLVMEDILAGVYVSEEEMRTYYEDNPEKFKTPERVKASHILVSVLPEMEEAQKIEARKKIESIKEKLNSGEDFEKLASEYSDCPSKHDGGNLDYFARGQMVKPFEDAAFALNPGETSDIVETQFGYHIIKVDDKEPAKTISFEEAKSELEEHFKNQKARDAIADYIAQLKEKATIR